MATDWWDVAAAVNLQNAAYIKLMKAREDERGGTKKLLLVEDAWLDTVEARRLALADHWVEADGTWDLEGETMPSLGTTLQRYYAETEPVRKAHGEAIIEDKAREAAKRKENDAPDND